MEQTTARDAPSAYRCPRVTLQESIFKSKACAESAQSFDSNQRLGRIPANASTPIKGLAGFRRTLRLQSKAWPDSGERFDSSQRLGRIPANASTLIKGSRKICAKLRLQSKARAESAQSSDSGQRLTRNPRKVLIPPYSLTPREALMYQSLR